MWFRHTKSYTVSVMSQNQNLTSILLFPIFSRISTSRSIDANLRRRTTLTCTCYSCQLRRRGWQTGREGGRSAGESSSVSRKSNRNVSPRNWNVLRRDEGLGSLRGLLPFGSNKRRLRSVRSVLSSGEGNSLALLRAAHRYRGIRIESNT